MGLARGTTWPERRGGRTGDVAVVIERVVVSLGGQDKHTEQQTGESASIGLLGGVGSKVSEVAEAQG